MGSKKKKYDTCLKESNNKTNELKSEKVKKSPSKNNVYSKVVTSSSPKNKLQIEKKGNSNGSLNISDKSDDKISKRSNFDKLRNNSTSASEEDKDTGKSSNKKAEIDLFDERIEKKKQRAILYEKYLQRGGARNPGSKEIPTVRNFTCNNNMNSERNMRLFFNKIFN